MPALHGSVSSFLQLSGYRGQGPGESRALGGRCAGLVAPDYVGILRYFADASCAWFPQNSLLVFGVMGTELSGVQNSPGDSTLRPALGTRALAHALMRTENSPWSSEVRESVLNMGCYHGGPVTLRGALVQPRPLPGAVCACVRACLCTHASREGECVLQKEVSAWQFTVLNPSCGCGQMRPVSHMPSHAVCGAERSILTLSINQHIFDI